ncbi:MAG: glycoside hydrolase family 31 protein [Rikenellaceae bacterium]
MIRKIFLQATLLLCSSVAMGQISSEIALKNLEKWWGASTAYATQMPFVEPTERSVRVSSCVLSSPIMVSNKGRYIVLSEQCEWSFDGKSFFFDGAEEVKVAETGRYLRDAYIVAVNRGVKNHQLAMPADMFFSGVVHNFSGELSDALSYAKSTTPGVLVLSQGWQSDYGALCFSDSSAKEIIAELHRLGFVVMLSVDSYVSPDSKYFRDFRDRGFLVCSDEGKPLIEEWKNGYSAVLNLNDSLVGDFMHSKLTELQSEYGVDGFSLCEGEIAADFNYTMVKSAQGVGINKSVEQLCFSSGLSWSNLQRVVPMAISAGLLSYPYTTFDMSQSSAQCNQELFIRALQAMVMMPVMQLCVDDFMALSDQNRAIAESVLALRAQFAPYILELAQQTAKTGEPIVRAMEYNYPEKGFWDCSDQFMLGTDYIVAPVLSKDNKRIVRLPRGRWVDDKGKTFKGPLVMEVNAGIDRLPYFKKK